MKAVLIFCLMLFNFLSTNVFAQDLWRNTKAGMTVEEVITVMPEAIKTIPPAQYGPNKLELLHVDNIEIVGAQFTAGLVFEGDKLSFVNIKMERDRNLSYAEDIYDKLVELFQAKYGQELKNKKEIDPRSLMSKAEAIWETDQTTIGVILLSVVDKENTIVSINYRVKTDHPDLDKI